MRGKRAKMLRLVAVHIWLGLDDREKRRVGGLRRLHRWLKRGWAREGVKMVPGEAVQRAIRMKRG